MQVKILTMPLKQKIKSFLWLVSGKYHKTVVTDQDHLRVPKTIAVAQMCFFVVMFLSW